MFTVTKQYRDLPAAHRQPKHDGHCRLIHGHNWGFNITFGCHTLDSNGFVIDVGKLGFVKQFLKEKFDHTLLLNEDDPLRREEGGAVLTELANVVIVPNCGMEGLAKYVHDSVEGLLMGEDETRRGVRVLEVVCLEDSKNSATYKLSPGFVTSQQDIRLA